MSTPQLLNPLTLPLHGARLIEASAGTGKTYTISGLYLRLLLGIGVESALTCEQILVVTFTNAATEELRDRIRSRIRQAYRACLGLPEADDFIQTLLAPLNDEQRHQALIRLDLALKSLDEAAIFTIHGFCQRILSDLAFESSLLFEAEFTLDDSEFLHHAVRDFWREHCYSLSGVLAQTIQSLFEEPQKLQGMLRPLLGNSEAIASPTPLAFENIATALLPKLARLKQQWSSARETLQQQLFSLSLNASRYGSQAAGYPKLVAAFEAMDAWVTSQHALPVEDVIDKLSLAKLKVNKTSAPAPTAEQAPLMALIDEISELLSNIKPAFLYLARDNIRARFQAQKAQRNVLTPDDLLSTLAHALGHQQQDQTAGQVLAKEVAKRFPMALIDEFQDTDPLQFAIFSRIYQQYYSFDDAEQQIGEQTRAALLMIGDPKQAIYAFRGGDIHTYIAAKHTTQGQYTLGTNYRSSESMVTAVNTLFSRHPAPFAGEDIPFEAVEVPPSATHKQLVSAEDNHAMQIRLLAEDAEAGLSKDPARELLAEDAAEQILALLQQDSQLQNGTKSRRLIARDIAVLVRDHNEASAMKLALSRRNIGAVFLSRDSVFGTVEARELALILTALINPREEFALRSAMATQLLGQTIGQIHQFNLQEDVRAWWLEQFERWHQLWLTRGIMPAIIQLAADTEMIQRLLNSENGERCLTDLRHLCELLQQKAAEADGPAALLHWYEQQLVDAQNGEEQQLRLESEQNLVQIVTIHKSKGLEYPVCFVPFVSLGYHSRTPEPLLYHDNNQLIWDLSGDKDAIDQQKQEQLAEDLRLLYVALTRPVYRCYLSVANYSRKLKAGIKSYLPNTAIGYLLGLDNEDLSFAELATHINQLSSAAISVTSIVPQGVSGSLQANDETRQNVTPLQLEIPAQHYWRVGSYSGLIKESQHHGVSEVDDLSSELPPQSPGMDDEVFDPLLAQLPAPEQAPAPRFLFEKGANAGSFMHQVLEDLDFDASDKAAALAAVLPNAMRKYGIAETEYPVLLEWYQQILAAPLGSEMRDKGLSLAVLKANDAIAEMEFYLPVAELDCHALNALLAQYGYQAGLSFETLRGMLKGFIDLTFQFHNRWYIADYKSNHLGNSFTDYHGSNLQQAMFEHRYDLQYLLYTLALHRQLSKRMQDYQYQRDIGGCYYLFLRGMSPEHPQAGIYYDRPPQALIEALDALFSGESAANADKDVDGTNSPSPLTPTAQQSQLDLELF
ncbi:exodeoxyribonuclease V subunit beta [Shewanella avicenniae]|uniref:RecBCD enzyme subunit RecB n=1 Tax=Shewanella avicenniae TaxID=2814294 RepID=A0ABX7QV10_9GAMM|nr:exodeoxyribonuclease V subunit beta [Shewanella avicenniae]QSX35322.1 exodeoxyribonuclease V subunit beta [Shewanella avicenniae]